MPTLWCITVCVFFLSQCTTQDPIEGHFKDEIGSTRSLPPPLAHFQYLERGRELGLDKPLFYTAILPYSYPDTLNRFIDKNRIAMLEMHLQRCGNWRSVEQYYQALQTLERAIWQRPQDDKHIVAANTLAQLYLVTDNDTHHKLVQQLLLDIAQNANASDWQTAVMGFQNTEKQLHTTTQAWKNAVPSLRWHGTDCQYQHWFLAMLGGDFGVSYTDQLPIGTRLARPLAITLLMSGLSMLLAYGIAIPLGVTLAARPKARWARWLDQLLMSLYTLPTFWIATMMVVFLTNDAYHLRVASVGLRDDLPADTSILAMLWFNLPRFMLPILCLALHHSVWLTRQLRTTMVEILKKDFIRTARAMGATERYIHWHSAFRNALFPLITLFGYLLPTVVTGSLVCEVVFSIPGFGRLTFDAMRAQDLPIVFAVVLIIATLTILGTILTDVCYTLAHPKVDFETS
jgi:peptide/nickel transport system permease protein